MLSHSVVSDSLWPPWTVASVHGDSPGKNADVGCHALLQGIFLTQGSNPGLSHCGQILYHLSHQGSPRILEWVAYSFFRGSSQPRNQTRVSCIAGGFFTSWATGKPMQASRSILFTKKQPCPLFPLICFAPSVFFFFMIFLIRCWYDLSYYWWFIFSTGK